MNQQTISVFQQGEEDFCSAGEHLRSICKQENQELLVIPNVKESFFYISNYSESAFNTYDFFTGKTKYSVSKEEYVKQQDLQRANKLAMLASCITDREMFNREKDRFWGIAEKLDQIRNAYKFKLEELQNIWDYWMKDSIFS